jgi:hypothetical protein
VLVDAADIVESRFEVVPFCKDVALPPPDEYVGDSV